MQLGDIRNISVIGAGTMGHGIGLTFALGGYEVTLNARRETSLSSAIRHIEDDLNTFAENGLITQDTIEKTLSRITTTTSLEEAVKNADFVTETALEDVEAKTRIFTDLDIMCPEHTILASNTSSLVLRDFTSQCKRKDKILLTHWINPPHIVPAVELLGSDETSDETIELVYALLRKVNKMPVKIRKEIPGLVINRIQVALVREVLSLWEQGVASPEDIDRAVKGSFGFRLAAIGPLENCDFGGLDIWYSVTSNLFRVISNVRKPPEGFGKMVQAGNLGFKSGKGFFDYNAPGQNRDPLEIIKERDNKFIQLFKLLYT